MDEWMESNVRKPFLAVEFRQMGTRPTRVCHVPALVPSMMCLVALGRFVQKKGGEVRKWGAVQDDVE